MNFFLQHGIVVLLTLYGIGAIGALLGRNVATFSNWWGNGFAILASSVGLITGISYLATPETASGLNMLLANPVLALSLYIDPLAALFVTLISGIGLVCSIYALGYVKHFYGKYPVGVLSFFYNIFLASMTLVVVANHAVLFLVVWELMSISSYFMIIYEHKVDDNIKSGFLYLVMTHIGTACIVLAFMLLYREIGSLSFADWRLHGESVPELMKIAIGGLALIGFGTKAGIIPLHAWLPQAHPAAPSHVSALMSGVMIKLGIYMIIRVFFDFIPGMPGWVGMAIVVIGATSSLLGVLYALAEHDLKRLLAFHSIENIGIILLGLGAALIFSSLGATSLAVLGLVAALYHTINHAVFKALLFLGAGSVVSQTHTRNIEEYGGLIKVMPITAACFLIGAIAISGLPPFNGFVSEWLTFQALFQGTMDSGLINTAVFIIGIGSLAFTGGLAAACFVKAFGVTFLAKARSDEASHARESSGFMTFSMGVLAMLCVFLGIGSALVVPQLTVIANAFTTDVALSELRVGQWGVLSVGEGFSSTSMLQVMVFLVVLVALVWFVVRMVNRRQKTTIAETWDCGVSLNPHMEITATAFSRSLIVIFKNYLQPVKHSAVVYRDGFSQYFAQSTSVSVEFKNVYDTYLYQPIHQAVIYLSSRLRQTQGGNLKLYLMYMFITLMGLLVWAAH